MLETVQFYECANSIVVLFQTLAVVMLALILPAKKQKKYLCNFVKPNKEKKEVMKILIAFIAGLVVAAICARVALVRWFKRWW